jgi:hypothetical protein
MEKDSLRGEQSSNSADSQTLSPAHVSNERPFSASNLVSFVFDFLVHTVIQLAANSDREMNMRMPPVRWCPTTLTSTEYKGPSSNQGVVNPTCKSQQGEPEGEET